MTRSHVHQSSAPWIAALAALALVCAGLAASAGEAKGAKSNAKSARDLYYEPAGGQPPAVGAVVPPPPTVKTSSELENIRDQLQNFPILLPDPAVPPVDPDIHLQSLLIED